MLSNFSEPSLDPILKGMVSTQEVIDHSRSKLDSPGADPRWCIPWAYVLWKNGDFSGAYAVSKKYLSVLQDDADFLLLFGMVCRQLPKHISEAEASFQAVISLAPSRSDAHYNLGNLYIHQERFDEAISEYMISLGIDSNSSLTWLNLGLAARSSDKLLLSYHALSQCLKLDPVSIRAWCNFGITCHQLELFGQAISSYEHALSLDRDDGPTLVNLAMSLNASNRHPESVGYLQAASSLTLQEDCGDALFNLALTRLLLGEFKSGWELYECRFKTRQYEEYTQIPSGEWIQSPERLFQLGAINSELLVWSEQGIGDAIQFVRYMNLLIAIGVRPVLATRSSLVTLFREWLHPDIPIIDDSEVDISTDDRPHTAMLSLPHLFATSRASVPCSIPYLNPPSPSPRALLVSEPPGALSIGFVWASNPDNQLMYKKKSFPASLLLEPLLPALREDLLVLHSLQVGSDASALDDYSNCPNIIDWNGHLGDFADTAHVLRQLDLVITVDTAVAHLAGALDIPCWLMLHFDSDFRWLRNCVSSPWYPRMRLFRQQSYGDWSSVSIAILNELGLIYGLDLCAIQ